MATNDSEKESSLNYFRKIQEARDTEAADKEANKSDYDKALDRLAGGTSKSTSESAYQLQMRALRRGNDTLLQNQAWRRKNAISAGAVALAAYLAFGAGLIADAEYGSDRAQRYVEQQGYTDVELIDKDLFLVAWRGCASDDSVAYDFKATAPNGTQNAGVKVCDGLLKAATIREGDY